MERTCCLFLHVCKKIKEMNKKWLHFVLRNGCYVKGMAIWVVKFPKEGYKISYIFAKNLQTSGKYWILRLDFSVEL